MISVAWNIGTTTTVGGWMGGIVPAHVAGVAVMASDDRSAPRFASDALLPPRSPR